MIGFKGTVSYGFYQSLLLNGFLNIFTLNATLFSVVWYSSLSSFGKGARLNTKDSGFESQRSLILILYIFLNSSWKWSDLRAQSLKAFTNFYITEWILYLRSNILIQIPSVRSHQWCKSHSLSKMTKIILPIYLFISKINKNEGIKIKDFKKIY